MLRLLPILPHQVHHQSARALVSRRIDVFNVVLPRPGGRAPFLSRRRRCRFRRVGCILARPLRRRRCCGSVGCWPAALLAPCRRLGLLVYVVSAANLGKVFV